MIGKAEEESGIPLVGVDEAGRGCLFGPVFAAAVVFNPLNSETLEIYRDSKSISEKTRNEVYKDIIKNHQVGVGFATSVEIDSINILQATFLAMKRAVESLNLNSAHICVDGNKIIPHLEEFSQSAIVKGDQKVPEISAASIVAKVSRDQYVYQVDKKFPEYELCKHKGYGTLLHKKRIKEHGPCSEHRNTFKGVREFIIQPPSKQLS